MWLSPERLLARSPQREELKAGQTGYWRGAVLLHSALSLLFSAVFWLPSLLLVLTYHLWLFVTGGPWHYPQLVMWMALLPGVAFFVVSFILSMVSEVERSGAAPSEAPPRWNPIAIWRPALLCAITVDLASAYFAWQWGWFWSLAFVAVSAMYAVLALIAEP